jgi:GNAT superfamily N-acetyltransferase
MFYVLSTTNQHGEYEIVGYFSKEKYSVERYNLSCVLILPPYQRKGYGRLLIEFSYELSKVFGVGGPERPLSFFGFQSYFSFWRTVLLKTMLDNPNRILTVF